MSNLYRRALFATCVVAATCAVDFGAHAASPFDGSYAGESPVVGSVSPACKEYHMTVVVKDGHFNTVVLTIPFSVDVGADGAFSATAIRPGGKGMGAVTGKISGDTMTMDYHAADCAHHAVLTRT
jgi:hypothetical protein